MIWLFGNGFYILSFGKLAFIEYKNRCNINKENNRKSKQKRSEKIKDIWKNRSEDDKLIIRNNFLLFNIFFIILN